MKKILLLILPLFLYSKCTYNLNLEFDLTNNLLTNNVSITDTSKSIQLNLENFDIKNKKQLLQNLQNGKNEVSFSYTIKDKNINPNFIYMLHNWYPEPTGLCNYKIKTNLSKEYKTIYEKTNKSIERATFIASKDYSVTTKKYNNIAISTYFFKQDKKLAKKYLDKTISYIKMYEKMIGEFPYKVFNIVENRATTGYSLPTYTLVGSYLLNKPYLLNRSLGHEILHQYFGNSIFNDHNKGNYSEGLTTHLSDNYYEKLKGNEVIQRKNDLLSYYTFATNEFPAKDFKYRDSKNSMAIGYTKVAFIFSMLEEKIGTKEFTKLLRKLYKQKVFKVVNLKDLRAFIQSNTKEDLSGFFAQWFDKTGRIDFEIKDIKKEYDNKGFKVSFRVIQKQLFEFSLPIFIKTYDGEVEKEIEINKKEQKVSFYVKSEPLKVLFDKEYKLFRKLFLNEYPLNIGKLIKTKNLIVIMDKKSEHKYKNIQKAFPNANVVYTDEVKFEELKKSSVIFLDANNDTLQYFFPRVKLDKNSSYLTLKKHTYNSSEQMAILNVPQKINRSFYMLKHYGNFKQILIKNREVLKELDKTENGFIYNFNNKPIISLIKKPETLNNITNYLNEEKIIYVGESHTNFTHHLNQLRVIKSLHKQGRKIAIGMEMFQTPFQDAINRYIEGKSTLKEFLKETEYYKRWKFNYNLYRPIIDYAKENKIPIIALNIDRSIIRKVSKNGILKVENKENLPLKIDQSSTAYKNELMKVFAEHDFDKMNDKKNKKDKHDPKEGSQEEFGKELKKDYFFQSQLIWDEIMAQNITKFMNKNRDYTLVVVAGTGHIEKHQGIPYRVYQDTNLPYKVILNDSPRALENDIVIQNNHEIKVKDALKIGVYLASDKNLTVVNLVPDSFGEKIGLKKGDLIVSFNDKEIKELSDLKIELYFLEDFKNSTLRVKRGDETIELKYK